MNNQSFDPQLKGIEHHPSCAQYIPTLPPNFIHPTEPAQTRSQQEEVTHPLQATPYPPSAEAEHRCSKRSCLQGMFPNEGSTTQNFLRVNRGKPARVYMPFANNQGWSVFNGKIDPVGEDCFILIEPKSGK